MSVCAKHIPKKQTAIPAVTGIAVFLFNFEYYNCTNHGKFTKRIKTMIETLVLALKFMVIFKICEKT